MRPTVARRVLFGRRTHSRIRVFPNIFQYYFVYWGDAGASYAVLADVIRIADAPVDRACALGDMGFDRLKMEDACRQELKKKRQ